MYYIIGTDQEGKLHMLAKADKLETIKFMRAAYRVGSFPNDFKEILVVTDIILPEQT
jgi:hypothetical protein